MRALLLALALTTPFVFPAQAATPEAACDSACDRDAATCVDRCESTHASDPAARVGCKVKCADTRKACSKTCKLARPPAPTRSVGVPRVTARASEERAFGHPQTCGVR
jgi:hypothetical protein